MPKAEPSCHASRIRNLPGRRNKTVGQVERDSQTGARKGVLDRRESIAALLFRPQVKAPAVYPLKRVQHSRSPWRKPAQLDMTGMPQTRLSGHSMMNQVQKCHRANEKQISKASFQKRFRLTLATEFERVFGENHRSVDGLFTVLYRRNGLGYPRLGLAIAKRQVRLAVDRNRLKRLIRESFRGAKQQLSDLDIVIMARHEAGTSDNAVIYASLAGHWRSMCRSTEN